MKGNTVRNRHFRIRVAALLSGVWLAAALAVPAFAETRPQPGREPARRMGRPVTVDKLALFRKGYTTGSFFSVEDVSDDAPPAAAPPAKPAGKSARGPVFVSSDPASHILPPDQDPKIRINPEAPGPFIGMVAAYQDGDMELAERYADQWVRYQMNFFFEVRELTQLIGEALVRQRVIDEDSWDGVGQLIDYEFAKTRKETGAVLKPQYDRALERIKPDPRNEVEIYYFFNLNCSWCRYMASDVERLWRATKNDRKVKMVGLLLDQVPQPWIDEYRSYTGMTMPIYSGPDLAKAFNIRFVPAMVVVTPNTKKAYLKTGQQVFSRMYEFIRRAQGLPATLTPELQAIAATPIGEQDRVRQSNALAAGRSAPANAGPVPVSMKFPDAQPGRRSDRFELGKF